MPANQSQPLTGLKFAILVDHGFLDIEMTAPRNALEQAGGQTLIVSPVTDVMVKSWHHDDERSDWGEVFKVDVPLDQASPDQYDGLLIPGGVISPDTLRTNETALSFVRAFVDAGKPVAAICHGPQVLIDAEVVEGRRMTSVKAIARDLRNAGARWSDEPCVVDQGLVTSRGPEDLQAFNAKMVEEFAEGIHAGQRI